MNYRKYQPSISKNVFVAPSAHVIGNVTLGENSSVWYNTVLRGDVNKIAIGNNSNIQDRVVVHVSSKDGATPTIIGNNVTIGRLFSIFKMILFFFSLQRLAQ